MPVIEMKSTGESDAIMESLERNAANLGIGEDEGESPPAPVEDEPAPSEPVEVEASVDEPPKRGRPLGSKNRPKEEPQVELSQDADSEEVDAEGEADAPQSLEPYEFWPADVKQNFSQVPRAVQEGLLRHEKERSTWAYRLQQETTDSRNYRKEVESAVPESVRKLMPFHGVKSEAELLRNAAGWIEAEQADPFRAALTYIQRLGFTPEDLMQGHQNGGYPMDRQDGMRSALPPEVEEKLRKIDELEAWRNEQSTSLVQREIDAFTASVDPKKMSFYEPHMVNVIQRINAEYPHMTQGEKLRTAYDIVDRHFSTNFGAPQVAPKPAAEVVSKAQKAQGATVRGSPVTTSPSAPKDLAAKIEFYANQLGI